MSFRSTSSLSIHSSTRPSPTHSTTSFYARPLAPPNTEIHIGNLPSDLNKGDDIEKALAELLSRQLGFIRVKVCVSKNLIGCFAIAYFKSIQCARDAKTNLQGHPFPGSRKGLNIDFAVPPKMEEDSLDPKHKIRHPGLRDYRSFMDLKDAAATGYPPATQSHRSHMNLKDKARSQFYASGDKFSDVNLRAAAAEQSQIHQAKHPHHDLNATSEPRWGYGTTILEGPDYTGRSGTLAISSPAASVVTREVLGDQPFDFSYGVGASNMGLEGSIYSNILVPATPIVSSKEDEGVSVQGLKVISKEFGPENPVIGVTEGGKKNDLHASQEQEISSGVDLLKLDTVLDPPHRQADDIFDAPRQDELKTVSEIHDGLWEPISYHPMLKFPSGPVAKQVIVKEAEMAITPQEAYTKNNIGIGRTLEPISQKEVVASPKQAAFENWNDAF